MTLLKEIERAICESEQWENVADSELLGIKLTEQQRMQVETVIKTLKFVKKIHLNIESEKED